MNVKMFYSLVISITLLLGGCIAWGILSSQWKIEAVKLSLEKGQNPLYVKCAIDGTHSEECKSMVMAMSLSGQFKDASAPISVSPTSTKK